jgi:hypothetical protein
MQTDGVLVYLPEQNSFTDEINRLELDGIPVVTLINDNPLSERPISDIATPMSRRTTVSALRWSLMRPTTCFRIFPSS